MNRVNVLTLAATATLLAACSPQRETPQASTAHEESPKPEARVARGTNGQVTLRLDAGTQRTMGLQTAPLASAQLGQELKAFGRVLNAAPLAVLVTELGTAQAASEVSQAELNRLKVLAAQGNAADRAVQAAEATAVRDRLAVESVRLRILGGWGGAIAERKDLAEFVRLLSSQANALVQLDLPAGQVISAPPIGARLFTLANETAPVSAQFLGPAPAVDPQVQGRAFLFLVNSNAAGLVPGASVAGYISIPGEAQTGVFVPSDALVRFYGAAWVYLQIGSETFQRVQVALDHPLAQGWFIGQGLKAADKVVIQGAAQLLSEELKGQGEEE